MAGDKTDIAAQYDFRLIEPDDAQALCNYFIRNREFHDPWSPLRPAEFFTVRFLRDLLRASIPLRHSVREFRFGAFAGVDGKRIVGALNLSSIERSMFQNGRLGYSVDHEWAGRGLMTDMIRRVQQFAFDGLQLHRLEANVIPHNVPSNRVLLRCGFRLVGMSPRMIKIADRWQDHNMYAQTVEQYLTRP